MDRVVVNDAFDDKYKSTLPKRSEQGVEAAIKSSSKLTTKKPAGKEATGLSVVGGVSLTKTEKRIKAELEWMHSSWPKVKMFGRAHSSVSVQVRSTKTWRLRSMRSWRTSKAR